jgi:protein associated with RNAse G/E
MITVNSRKYDLRIRRSWTCELMASEDTHILCSGEFDTDVIHPELGHIARGTLSYEYYWLDRWYNIFRFHEPDGSFRNFYCNIAMPAAFDGEFLDYVDLDIDVVVWPDMSHEVLDLVEFEINAAELSYPDEVRSNAEAGLKELLELISDRSLPYMPVVST